MLIYRLKLRSLFSHFCKSPYTPSRQLNVLFYGSDSFSVASLMALNKAWRSNTTVHELGVVTAIKKPPNLVQSYAEKNKIPIFSWPKGNEEVKFDIGIVVSFSHLIPEHIINSFPLGMINLHASLLPRWRGAAPIIYSILSGDKTTGVTVMKIRPKHFDVGEILKQKELEIDSNILMPELHSRLAELGADLLLKCLEEGENTLLNGTSQPNEGITFAPKVEGNSLGSIDWNRMTALEVYDRFRALYSFRPIVTSFRKHTIKLVSLSVYNFSSSNPDLEKLIEGEFIYNKAINAVIVKCSGDCSFVAVYSLRIDGKRSMTATEFWNGYVKKIPKICCRFETIKV